MSEQLDADHVKRLHLVFSRAVLEENFESIKADLEKLVIAASQETELVSQDNLARGIYIDSGTINAFMTGEEQNKYWRFFNNVLYSPLSSEDPPEYWGSFRGDSSDFIAGATTYPWMPSAVSAEDFPWL